MEAACAVQWPLKGPTCQRDYEAVCPLGWLALSDGRCLAPLDGNRQRSNLVEFTKLTLQSRINMKGLVCKRSTTRHLDESSECVCVCVCNSRCGRARPTSLAKRTTGVGRSMQHHLQRRPWRCHHCACCHRACQVPERMVCLEWRADVLSAICLFRRVLTGPPTSRKKQGRWILIKSALSCDWRCFMD